jgi:hypothetical protein
MLTKVLPAKWTGSGYSISTVNDPYRKLREGSPTYKPPVLPVMKSAPVKTVGNDEDDNERAGENGIWVYDWKSSMPENIRETIERGEAILASGQLPSAYTYLLPEGLSKEDDIIIVTDTMLTLSVMTRDRIGFDEIVSRVKRNGFIGKTTVPGKQFIGGNGQGQTCMVTNMSANGYVTVVIEDASEEDNDDVEFEFEFENIGSNMERLQKQMQEISKEIMAHPERAEELREKILKINLEMQKETQRLQEKVRK